MHVYARTGVCIRRVELVERRNPNVDPKLHAFQSITTRVFVLFGRILVLEQPLAGEEIANSKSSQSSCPDTDQLACKLVLAVLDVCAPTLIALVSQNALSFHTSALTQLPRGQCQGWQHFQ